MMNVDLAEAPKTARPSGEGEIAELRRLAATRTHRLAVVGPAGNEVVVKGQRRTRSVLRQGWVNGLIRASGLALLQSPALRGGAAGQAVEVERLRALRAGGVPVPEVLHVDADFFVMQRLAGPSLVECIERGDGSAPLWWQRGMRTLVDVHRRGHYLSQAFVRNFIVTGGGLALIDFEDDPGEVLSVAEAQARDWLAYLHSSAWLIPLDAVEASGLFFAELARDRDETRARVEDAGRRLAWLRHLPRSRRPWGREVVGAQALGRLFHGDRAALERRA